VLHFFCHVYGNEWILSWDFFAFTGARPVALSRKSSDSLLQQQTNSAGPTGRSTPTPIGAITIPPAAPHSPILEDVSSSKTNDTTSTMKASEEDSSAEKPTMMWGPENTQENGSHVLQNCEFNLDLDDILKIDSLPLLTVSIVFETAADIGIYLHRLIYGFSTILDFAPHSHFLIN
jgi:hypothetical protein